MSTLGGVHSVNGMFTVTDAGGKTQTVDLGMLLMLLNIDRVSNLDSQIAVQLSEIQERNGLLTKYTEILSYCRKLKAEGWGDGTSSGQQWTVTINGETKPLWVNSSGNGSGTWAEELGLEWSQHKGYAGGKKPTNTADAKDWENTWDTNINNIKSKMELLNNDSQMANIKLQNLLEKRNNAFEMTTKVMDTNNQSIQSILRNL